MIGAIAGDVIGSVYEFDNIKTMDFPLFRSDSTFTDDSVLTFAVADCLLHGLDYAETIRRYAQRYPDRGYGAMFRRWVESGQASPYNSFGNGSAMRVSPVGFACDTETSVLDAARRSAEVTHNHPEGIKGAQATALAIFFARKCRDKAFIRAEISRRFSYDLSRRLDDIRPDYRFNETCQGSVPEALVAFLESDGYEDAVRKAVSLGGDSDTIACIAGGVAAAFYRGVPYSIATEVRQRLPPELLSLLDEFEARFPEAAGNQARKNSWKNLPLPAERSVLPYSAEFSLSEFDRVARGFFPLEMKDKWFIYLEGSILYFHRSWTGYCLYQVEFARDGDKHKVVRAFANRNRDQYTATDDDYDSKLLNFLISNLLLGKRIDFPRPPGAAQEFPPGLIQHAFSGTSYSENDGSSPAPIDALDAKVAEMLKGIIRFAMEMKASEIRLVPFEGPRGQKSRLLLSYRVNGALAPPFNLPWAYRGALMALIKIWTTTMDITERRAPQTGRIQIVYLDKPLELDVETQPGAHGEECVMRVLDDATSSGPEKQAGY